MTEALGIYKNTLPKKPYVEIHAGDLVVGSESEFGGQTLNQWWLRVGGERHQKILGIKK